MKTLPFLFGMKLVIRNCFLWNYILWTSLFVINGISVIRSDNSVMFIFRLVEEVKDACSVTLEADDIYMNTRYCFHWRFLHKLWFFFFFLDTGISVPQYACPGENAPVFVIFCHENMTLKNLSPMFCFWFQVWRLCSLGCLAFSWWGSSRVHL